MIAQINKYHLRKVKFIYRRLLSYFLYEGRPLTTKGRWFNFVTFFYLKLVSKIFRNSLVEDPIFILGTGRSGTTILGDCLGFHKDLIFMNEPKALWYLEYDKDDLLKNYSQNDGSYYYPEKKVLSGKIHSFYESILFLTRANRVVDKYPEMVFRTKTLQTNFKKASYIFLFRNGFDTLSSISKWSRANGLIKNNHTENWWGADDIKWKLLCEQVLKYDEVLSPYFDDISAYNDDLYRAAVEWILTMKEGMKYREEKSFIFLRYEDFVSNKKVRTDLLASLKLSDDEDFNFYCNAALNYKSRYERIILPKEIDCEFRRIMKELGYDE